MINRRTALKSGIIAALAAAFKPGWAASAQPATAYQVTHTDAEWKKLLNSAQYNVLRQEGTERPFASPLLHEERRGVFNCAGCDQALFSSTTKFDSGTGWPSFWAPLPKGIGTEVDGSLFMKRTSVHCSRCGGHLGHVFDDGPKPTGLRYCMNGVAMSFKPQAT